MGKKCQNYLCIHGIQKKFKCQKVVFSFSILWYSQIDVHQQQEYLAKFGHRLIYESKKIKSNALIFWLPIGTHCRNLAIIIFPLIDGELGP
jgi:hypothetical protein